MYKWKIKITLQGGGIIDGREDNDIDTSDEVFRKLFFVKNIQDSAKYFVAISNLDKTSQIFVDIFHISAVEISAL